MNMYREHHRPGGNGRTSFVLKQQPELHTALTVTKPMPEVQFVRPAALPTTAILLHTVSLKDSMLGPGVPHASLRKHPGRFTTRYALVDGNGFIFSDNGEDDLGKCAYSEARRLGDLFLSHAIGMNIKVLVVSEGFSAVSINGVAVLPCTALQDYMRQHFRIARTVTADMLYQRFFEGFYRAHCNFL